MIDRAVDPWAAAKECMLRDHLVARGVQAPAVLEAMRAVPRQVFVPEGERRRSYDDVPLSIGQGQTISQPYIVALMTELARLEPTSRVLEIGTGCGYQTAVLAACSRWVWTIELEPELAARGAKTLAELGVANVTARVGDGSLGWPEASPFDAILVTAAPAEVPPALLDQLAEGGRLVIPLGTTSQELWVYTGEPEGIRRRSIIPVRFVLLR